MEQARELVEEFKRVRLLYYGDYYPLTEYSTKNDAWMAYQFHREDVQTGMILAFRRDNALDASLDVIPRACGPRAAGLMERTYKVEFIDEHVERQMTGEELIAGIEIIIENAPDAALIVYSRT